MLFSNLKNPRCKVSPATHWEPAELYDEHCHDCNNGDCERNEHKGCECCGIAIDIDGVDYCDDCEVASQ